MKRSNRSLLLSLALVVASFATSVHAEPVVVSKPGVPYPLGENVTAGIGLAGDASIASVAGLNCEYDQTCSATGPIVITVPGDGSAVLACNAGGPIYVRNCDPTGFCTVRVSVSPGGCAKDTNGSATVGASVGVFSGNGGVSFTGSTDRPMYPFIEEMLRRQGVIVDISVQLPPGATADSSRIIGIRPRAGGLTVEERLKNMVTVYAIFADVFSILSKKGLIDNDKLHDPGEQLKIYNMIVAYMQAERAKGVPLNYLLGN